MNTSPPVQTFAQRRALAMYAEAQRTADTKHEARLRTLPLPERRKTDTPRATIRHWISEQMRIPESHETLWLLAFSVVTLCIGLLALWSTP